MNLNWHPPLRHSRSTPLCPEHPRSVVVEVLALLSMKRGHIKWQMKT